MSSSTSLFADFIRIHFSRNILDLAEFLVEALFVELKYSNDRTLLSVDSHHSLVYSLLFKSLLDARAADKANKLIIIPKARTFLNLLSEMHKIEASIGFRFDSMFQKKYSSPLKIPLFFDYKSRLASTFHKENPKAQVGG
jgi:hypothetical protein